MKTKTILVVAEHRCQLEKYKRNLLADNPCLVGWEFHTLWSLAQKTIQLTQGTQNTLSGVAQSQILHHTIGNMVEQGELLPSWQMPGAIAQIAQLLRETRLEEKTTAADILPANAKLFDKVRQQYESALAKKLDDAGIMRALEGALRNTEASAIHADELHLIGFAHLRSHAWQSRLLDALQQGYDKVIKSVQVEGAAPVCPEWIQHVMCGQEVQIPEHDGILDRPTCMEFHEYSSVETELRGLARRLRALLANTHKAGNTADTPSYISPEDILVVVPDSRYHRERLTMLLDTYEIPHDAVASSDLSCTPLGRFIVKLIKLTGDNLKWTDFLWVLSSPFVSNTALYGDTVGGMSVRSTARTLRNNRLRDGNWAQLESSLSSMVQSCKERAAICDDDSESERERLNRKAEWLEKLDSRFSATVKALRSVLNTASEKTCTGWAQWMLDTLDTVNTLAIEHHAHACGIPHQLPEYQAILDVCKTLSDRASDEQSLSSEEFSKQLGQALRASKTCSRNPATEAVAVRTCSEVEDASWPYVFVVGMQDGLLPARAGEGGILSDTERAACKIPTSTQINDEADAYFSAVLPRASGSLVFSYSTLAPDGKRSLEAPPLQRLDDFLATWETRDGQHKRISRFRSTWLDKHSPKLILPDEESAVTPAEALVVNNLEARIPLGEAAERLVAPSRSENWISEDGTEHDCARFGDISIEEGLTPSRLDQFGLCPYRYFASAVLGLEQLRELDVALDPMQLGTALHEALEETVKKLLEEKGSEHFVCGKSDRDDRIAKFLKLLEGYLKQSLEKLISDGMGLQSDAVLSLCSRWCANIRTTVAELLFIVDPEEVWAEVTQTIQNKAKEDTAGTPSKRQYAMAAEKLLQTWEGQHAVRAPLEPTPDGYPRGYTNIFKKLLIINKKALNLTVPQMCEWTFGSRDCPLNVGSAEGIPLRGKIDRIDICRGSNNESTFRVWDYKSGSKLPSVSDITAGVSLQIQAYVLAVETALKSGLLEQPSTDLRVVQVDKAGLISMKSKGRKDPGISVNDQVRSQAQEILRIAADHIKHGQLAPLPRKSCPVRLSGRCDYEALCRVQTLPEVWFEQGYPELTGFGKEQKNTTE